MPDIAAIGAFIASIKNATDIAKVIREAGTTLEKAEIKLKLAELIEALAEAKIQASEIKEVLQEKDRKIAELEKAFELNAKLVRKDDAYYEISEEGEPIGAPFCSHCWEINHVTVHLNHMLGGMMDWICPACKNTYTRRRVHILTASTKTDAAT